jgi:DNA-binding NarL/FixJ family response regulator
MQFQRGQEMSMAVDRTVFATRQPLLIAGVGELLQGGGLAADPQIVDPEELGRALAPAGNCLVILDGHALPARATLRELCRLAPGSFFVLWTVRPTADLLQAALECGLHGLLSARLPLEEAAQALRRICRGERLFRFDSNPGPLELPKPFPLSAREQQVLYVLASGGKNAAIAEALQTTRSSVKVCLGRMFRKTGARNRQELVMLAQSGILAPAEPRRQATAAPLFDAQWMLNDGDSQRRGF